MKRKICAIISAINFFMVLGIVGNVERELAPFSDLKWCMPLLIITALSMYIGGFFNDCE